MDSAGLASLLNKTKRESTKKTRSKTVNVVNPVVDEMKDTLDYEGKIKKLEQEVLELHKAKESIKETMPVSKKEVSFSYELIDPDLIDVSVLNVRDQSLLTKESVSDIFDSIRDDGQQQPGLLRPKENGRFEAIDGSRRKFVCTTLGRKYLAKIGDIPDEDVEALSKIGNKYLPISDYEWGVHYLKNADRFKTANKLHEYFADRDDVSKSTVRNRCVIAAMPAWFVNLYVRPNDIAATGIIELQAKMKDGVAAKLLKKRAAEIRKQYLAEFKESQEWPAHSRIVKDLTSVLKKPKSPAPKAEKIENEEGVVIYSRKQSNKGSLVLELLEGTPEQRAEIEAFIAKTLG